MNINSAQKRPKNIETFPYENGFLNKKKANKILFKRYIPAIKFV